jgi:tetratricopeptide (TPR) repeat protein
METPNLTKNLLERREKMKFTKIFMSAVLVCFLAQLALGQKAKKPRFSANTYRTSAKTYLKDEYRMYDTVIVLLNEAISFYPNDPELHFLLGKAYYHKNKPVEMGEQFSQAESLGIKSKFQKEIKQMRGEKLSQVYNQGVNAFNEQKIDLALEKFQMGTMIDPHYYKAFMFAGYAYSLKGENEKAIPYLEKALELAPDSLDILTIYAAALHNAGNVKKALEFYLKVAEKNPKDVNTLNQIISIYGDQKEFDKALLFSEKLIAVDSSFGDAYFNMGTIYLQQIQEINLRLDSLKDTTGVYRSDEKSKGRKEELEKKRSELFAKAESSLRKAVELDTLDLETQLLLAQAYLGQEKFDQALRTLEFLVQEDSTNCEAIVRLWGLYAKKEMKEKVMQIEQKAQDCLKKE